MDFLGVDALLGDLGEDTECIETAPPMIREMPSYCESEGCVSHAEAGESLCASCGAPNSAAGALEDEEGEEEEAEEDRDGGVDILIEGPPQHGYSRPHPRTVRQASQRRPGTSR